MNNALLQNHQVAKSDRRPPFWEVQKRAILSAIFIDFLLFVIFYYLNSQVLAWFNVLSVIIYTMAYRALKSRKNKAAAILIFVEVLAHAAVGVAFIGWDSGFHYYLLLFIPGLCFNPYRPAAITALILLFSYYIGMNMLGTINEPLQPIHPTALKLVYLFNIGVVFALLSYLSFFYLGSVKKAQKKLHKLATTDPLTTLYNRRHLNVLANVEVTRAKNENKSFGIILIDVDHFKSINDTYGHEAGDKVLVSIADVLKDSMQKQDIIARWGGEEFLILLPHSSVEEAKESTEKVQKALTYIDWETQAGIKNQPTISAGISTYQETDDLSKAIARADQALYKSKALGRNRIELEASAG